ncbi:MAG: hypothetical protein KKB31_02265 [Nanoarchaeota archaeon]|nr:hypothetical protein [Nanoarchaeota archaeon]
MCWCKWWGILLLAVIVVFDLVEVAASKWLIFGAAIILLIHALFCHKCFCEAKPKMKPQSKKRKKK